jgi:hypothetical protein
MIAYALCPPAPAIYDEAVSPAAESLRDRLAEAIAPRTSVRVDTTTVLVDRLVTAIQEGLRSGESLPSPETIRRAFTFAASIPADVAAPDVVIESDGEIGFDWDYAQRRVLSVSVGEAPVLRFATLIGAEPVHGRIPYAGVFPQTLAYFLKRLQSVD